MLPAVVPGAFDAWCLLLRDWGTWELADVLAYAIGYANSGIHIVPRISATIEGVRRLFEQEWTSSAAVFLPGGKVPAPGSLFARPALGATYERICREAVGGTREARIDAARGAWYRGFVAEAVDRFFRSTDVLDVTGRHHRGLLTADDFSRWSATVEDPVAYDYAGHTVLKCGPWSQGPVFLQQLALLRGFDIGAMDPCGADFVHLVVECAKLAYADREAFYGDPGFVPGAAGNAAVGRVQRRAPRAGRCARRRWSCDPARSMATRPGWTTTPRGRAALVPRAPGAGEPTVARLGVIGADTCHVDVIDRHGNMVSATPSGGWLQSSPVIPELGFCLGTRGQMFWLRDGLPNSLAPGKRPRTTLSPSFALRGGKPWMAFGTPGGEQQDQWSLIFFLRMVHHGMSIQQAIDTPSFHTEHWPSSFWPRAARPGKVVLEGRFDDGGAARACGARALGGEGGGMVGGAAVGSAGRGGRADVCRGQSARACRATRSGGEAALCVHLSRSSPEGWRVKRTDAWREATRVRGVRAARPSPSALRASPWSASRPKPASAGEV